MRYFDVPYKSTVLKGTIHGTVDPRVVCIHGATDKGSARFDMLRQHLAKVGIASAAFDFIGAGRTGGELAGSSLADRLEQARTVVGSIRTHKPLIVIGASMGADTAIRLTQHLPVSTLILCVPAFYSHEAFFAPFPQAFHDVIVRPDNWRDSDTWQILHSFSGSLLVIGAEQDEQIPAPIYDLIDEHTPHVFAKELVMVPRAPHRLLPYLTEHHQEFAHVFERVYHAIVRVGEK